MRINVIKAIGVPGNSIQEETQHAIELAKEHNCLVELSFNAIEIPIYPSSTVKSACMAYYWWCEREVEERI